MGGLMSRMYGFFWSKPREWRILMVGLDSAGKTTILFKLKLGEVITTVPTIGFNVETLEFRGALFTVWDVGGQDRIRALWKHYYANTDGIVYVLDSADKERVELAAEELRLMLGESELTGVACLVYANKQDLPGALGTSEVAMRLGLRGERRRGQRQWHVQPSCAKSGEGLVEGLSWLWDAVKDKKRRRG